MSHVCRVFLGARRDLPGLRLLYLCCAPRLDGEPTREQQAAAYFERSGRTPIDTYWYEVFAAARYCSIVVRVMNRTVERGLMPAGSDYWKDNQATACLEELLG